jgi:hypothetical protein
MNGYGPGLRLDANQVEIEERVEISSQQETVSGVIVLGAPVGMDMGRLQQIG